MQEIEEIGCSRVRVSQINEAVYLD